MWLETFHILRGSHGQLLHIPRYHDLCMLLKLAAEQLTFARSESSPKDWPIVDPNKLEIASKVSKFSWLKTAIMRVQYRYMQTWQTISHEERFNEGVASTLRVTQHGCCR